MKKEFSINYIISVRPMSDSKSRFLMYRYSHTFYYDRLVCSNWKNRAMYGYLILFYGWVVLTRGWFVHCLLIYHSPHIIGYGVDEFIYFDIVQPSQLAFLYKILPAKDFGGLFVSNCYYSYYYMRNCHVIG